MWSDYEKTRKTNDSAALKAWAKKYKVQLKGKQAVVTRVVKGSGPVPARPATAAATNCSDICHIRKFERWEKHGRTSIIFRCSFDSCEYDKRQKMWVCFYKCLAGIRMQ